jgi:hypothetical protein
MGIENKKLAAASELQGSAITLDASVWIEQARQPALAGRRLNALRKELVNRRLEALPSDVRTLLSNWREVIQSQSDQASLAWLGDVEDALARQRRHWLRACRKATRMDPGILGRWRCLRLHRRFVRLTRKFERVRAELQAAQHHAASQQAECLKLKTQASVFFGVAFEANEGLSPQTLAASRRLETYGTLAKLGVERALAECIAQRERHLAGRIHAAEQALSHHSDLVASAAETMAARPDIMVMLRSRYELDHQAWPTHQTEQALVATLAATAADLVPEWQRLASEREALKRRASEIRTQLMNRMQRVSRFVVPESEN